MVPQNIEINGVKPTMYTKSVRTEVNATFGRIKHQRNIFFCVMNVHTSMDTEQPPITCDINVTPEQCKQASKRRSLTLFDLKLTFEKGDKETQNKWKEDVKRDYIQKCKDSEWITKDIFESHKQDITQKMRIEDDKIFKQKDQLIPCDLDKPSENR